MTKFYPKISSCNCDINKFKIFKFASIPMFLKNSLQKCSLLLRSYKYKSKLYKFNNLLRRKLSCIIQFSFSTSLKEKFKYFRFFKFSIMNVDIYLKYSNASMSLLESSSKSIKGRSNSKPFILYLKEFKKGTISLITGYF